MSYLVLARRWRPQKFADLVGQDVVVRTLQNALAAEAIAHAYLFTGIRGVGKTTLARLLAMAVNCEQAPTREPCGECEACVSIGKGSALDVQEMDAASHTGVDDIREIIDAVRYPPTRLRYKVYIVDEAHMLSKHAFNALLKTLEEPPERVLFVLATTEVEKVPLTVRSRCQRFDLRRLSTDEIESHLAHVLDCEKVPYEEEALREIAAASEGSVRDALSLVEQVIAFSGGGVATDAVEKALGLVGEHWTLNLADAVLRGDAFASLTALREATAAGHQPRALWQAIGRLLHQLACSLVDETFPATEKRGERRRWLEAWRACWDLPAVDMRYQVLLHGLQGLDMMDERRGSEMLALRMASLNRFSPPLAMPPKAVCKGSAKEDSAQTALQHGYASWADAVRAYAQVKPGIAAMLERVLCLEFSDKVRLALDEHQQKAITIDDRLAFAEWLGKQVHWEPKGAQDGQSLSEIWEREAKARRRREFEAAERDPHLSLLKEELGAKVVKVHPAGTKANAGEQAEDEG